MFRGTRSFFLLFATMLLTLSIVSGCSTNGSSGNNDAKISIMEIQNPSVTDLDQVPEGSLVGLEMANGKVFQGAYISYSPETSSLLVKVGQDYSSPSNEFNEEEGTWSFVLEDVAVLTVFESPDHSSAAGISIGIAAIITGFLALVALAYSSYN